MKITVELTTIDEMAQFLDAMKAKDLPVQEAKPERYEAQPMPMTQETIPLVPKEEPKPAPAPDPKPAAPSVSFEDVTKAAIKLMDTGKQDALRGLLTKYGVPALPALKDDPEKLAAFYKDLEVI